MKTQVPSYDLLQNEKYGRLEELKNALEGLNKKKVQPEDDEAPGSSRV